MTRLPFALQVSGSSSTGTAKLLATQMSVCERCWATFRGQRGHTCRKQAKATARSKKKQPTLPVIDGLVLLLGQCGDVAMFAVRSRLQMSSTGQVSASRGKKTYCLVRIDRACATRSQCFHRCCEGQANRALPWCVHLEAATALVPSEPQGLRLNGFMALVPGLLETGRVCKSTTCQLPGQAGRTGAGDEDAVGSLCKQQRRAPAAMRFAHGPCGCPPPTEDDGQTVTTAVQGDGEQCGDGESADDEDEGDESGLSCHLSSEDSPPSCPEQLTSL